MKEVIVNYDLIEYHKDFIPREHNLNDCELINIEFGYRSYKFSYLSPAFNGIEVYELILDAF